MSHCSNDVDASLSLITCIRVMVIHQIGSFILEYTESCEYYNEDEQQEQII